MRKIFALAPCLITLCENRHPPSSPLIRLAPGRMVETAGDRKRLSAYYTHYIRAIMPKIKRILKGKSLLLDVEIAPLITKDVAVVRL